MTVPESFKPGAPIADMPVVKVLAVGDSMTHGVTGTKTWRANLFEEGIRQGVHLEFVGPRDDITDTTLPWAENDPDPPPSPTPTVAASERVYFDEPEGFSRNHGAQSGSGFPRPALDYTGAGLGWGTHLEIVPAVVKKYQPDVLILLLGFNDLLLSFGDNKDHTPGMIAAMTRSYVAQAQTAKGDLDVVWGTIPATNLGWTNNPNVEKNETAGKVNDVVRDSALFKSRVDGNWDGGGRICVAEINASYKATLHSYDGIHPSLLGEKVMAQEFAKRLTDLKYLSEPPKIDTTSTPPWFTPTPYVSTGGSNTTTFYWVPERWRYNAREVQLNICNMDGKLVKDTGWIAASKAVFGPGTWNSETYLPAGPYTYKIRMRRGLGDDIMTTPWSALKTVQVSYKT